MFIQIILLITLENNTTGDPALINGVNACIGDTWIPFGELETGKNYSQAVSAGEVTIKVIRGTGASGPTVCTSSTSVNGFIVYQETITVEYNQNINLDISGLVTRYSLPNISYNTIDTYPLGAGELGIFTASPTGESFGSPSSHCFNGVNLTPAQEINNVTLGGQLGYINVYDLNGISNGDVRLSYGYSFSTEDSSCSLVTVYPTIYPYDLTLDMIK